MLPVLLLHGPNLNLLGVREPGMYGRMGLDEINRRVIEAGQAWGMEVRTYHSNHEGALIDQIHDARVWARGIVFNPAGYTHTSVALRDAVAAITVPVIEVHLSNTQAREEFRRQSLIGPVCAGSVAGFGWRSYIVGLYALKGLFEDMENT